MMDEPVSGPLLLVGEGDFSFSLALVNKLNRHPPISDHHQLSVISTSLDEGSSLLKHKNLPENVEKLRSIGAIVLHGIDATKLETYHFNITEKFSRIIFNFPHSGGKSNIKKNRDLLKDFFISASRVLSTDGDILMTLARGQGGTPADLPRRTWGNSWQVVAAASYADLILTSTQEFHRDSYVEYSCTGFRSRDAWFHTEGAVTHRFIHAVPNTELGTVAITVPCTLPNTVPCTLPTTVPCTLPNTVPCTLPNTIPCTLPNTVPCTLPNTVPCTLPNTVPCTLPNTVPGTGTEPVPGTVPNAFPDVPKAARSLTVPLVYSDQTYLVHRYVTRAFQRNFLESPHHPFAVLFSRITSQLRYDVILEPSPFLPYEHVRTKSSEQSQNIVLAMKVADKCMQDGVYDRSCDNLDSAPENDKQFVIFKDSVPKQEFSACVLRSSLLLNVEDIRIKSVINSSQRRTVLLYGPCFRRLPLDDTSYPIRYELCLIKRLELKTESNITNDTNFEEEFDNDFINILKDDSSAILGLEIQVTDEIVHIGFGATRYGWIQNSSQKIGHYGQIDLETSKYDYCCLFLDDIASLKFNIDDKRLLWSLDERLKLRCRESDLETKFKSLTLESEFPLTYDCLSVYPCEWTQELSFWVSECYDESVFYDIVRDVCDDNIKSVRFIEDYTSATGRYSRNYRLVMTSCDRALSRHLAHSLYLQIQEFSTDLLGVCTK